MSKKLKKSPKPKSVSNNPPKIRYALILCVAIAGTCSITTAVAAFWKFFAPKSPTDLVLFAIAAISIYTYTGLDIADKCKKWGLIKN